MLEGKMWEKLKKGLADYPILLRRVENRTGGFPDVYFSTKKNNGWIELKNIRIAEYRAGINNGYTTNTRTDQYRIKIPFRPGQYPWIRDHLRYNDNVYLLCSVGQENWFVKKGNKIKEHYDINELQILDTKSMIFVIHQLLIITKNSS